MAKYLILFLLCICGVNAQQVISQGRFVNISASDTVQAAHFIGDGSGLTNVGAGVSASDWYGITRIPVQVQNVSNSGNVSLSGVNTISLTATTVTVNTDIANLVSASQVSASVYTGNASSATVVATGASLAKSIADAVSNYGQDFYISESGVICDGTSHVTNLIYGQSLLDRAATKTWSRIHFPHNCKWGTNATTGAVNYISLTSGGSGYTSTPTAVISDSALTAGTTCTGQVVSVTMIGGQVTSVTMTSFGSGCTKDNPQVLFSGGGGSGASAVATIEHPLHYHSRQYLSVEGTQIHNINSGDQAWLEGEFNDDSSQSSTTLVVVDYGTRGVIEYATGSSHSKKGFIGSNTKNIVTMYERVSGTSIDSFNSQCRNCYNMFRIFPQQGAGDSQGEDRFHVTGDSQYVFTVIGNDTGGDDCGSVTEETSGHAGKTAAHIYWYGGRCGSYANSSSKIECSTSNAHITDVGFIGTHFDIVGNGTDGGVLKWDAEDCPVDHVWLRDVIADASNGQPYAGGPSAQLTSLKPCGLNYVDLGNLQIRGPKYRGIEIDGNVCNVKMDNPGFSEYAGQLVQQTGITFVGASRNGLNTIRFDAVSGTINITPTTSLYVSTSGFVKGFNNGVYAVTSITTNYILATATGVSTSTLETGVSASGSIYFDPGVYVYNRGGYNLQIKGATIDGGPGLGIQLTTDSGKTYTILSSQYYAENTARLTVSTTTGNIQQESPYAGYITTSGFANAINNYTNGKITAVDVANKYLYVNVPGLTSATDETGTFTGATIYIPTNANIIGTTCINQDRGSCISIQAGFGTRIADTHCIDSEGDKCATETSATIVSGTLAYGNIDDGMISHSRGGFTWSDPDHADIFMNRSDASGNDWFSTIKNIGTISPSWVKAVSATINGISATNVSVTGVGSFGSISVSAFATAVSKSVCAGPSGLYISPTCP